jgi:hypothetical protein
MVLLNDHYEQNVLPSAIYHLSSSSWQGLCMEAMLVQKSDQPGSLYASSQAGYTEDAVAVLQIEISPVIHEAFVDLIKEHGGMDRVPDIGFEDFYHHKQFGATPDGGSRSSGALRGHSHIS